MQHRENAECIVCVYDDVWGIYSGELIYHPVDALKWAK